MSRDFAGILGPLAFVAVVGRSLLIGGDFDEMLQWATLSLFVFAGIGFLAGAIAEQAIIESVRIRINAELDGQEENEQRSSPAAN